MGLSSRRSNQLSGENLPICIACFARFSVQLSQSTRKRDRNTDRLGIVGKYRELTHVSTNLTIAYKDSYFNKV